jgi:hypothetical protein
MNKIYILFLYLLFTSACFSQESKTNLDSISREFVNPISSFWTVNDYFEVNQKAGNITNESRTSVNWMIQPVMPIPLNKSGLKLMNRPELSIMLYNPIPTTDTNSITTFNNHVGLGDFLLISSLGKMGKTKWGMFMWGAGLTFIFPTASNKELGSGKYSLGPSGMLVGFSKISTFGIVVTQGWSYAGDPNRKKVNQMSFQLIYFFQIKNGWQVGDNPTWTFNWNGKSGDKYNIPIGFGIYKSTTIGKSLFRFGITPRYYLKTMESWGNVWGINFVISPMLKNPFVKNNKGMKKM